MEQLTSIHKDFSEWYIQIIQKAGLSDYGPVKGTMIFKPYGFAIWKNVQKFLGDKITEDGVEDVYFPMFIPYSFLAAEKDHVEGFAPEVAMVTEAGGEKLEEPLVIRPTSETIMYKTFANWIQSYRDLPLKINQWVNVVRWEKRTVPFLRNSEFLWQEGHTAHATKEAAIADVFEALHRYDDFLRTYMAVPAVKGYKTDSEKFAGADFTTTLEALLVSNKALQIGTSHMLGQNFSKAFGISFLDESNNAVNPWQTSWGLSTRSIGGMIGVHGDDKGLVMPPMIAPIQVVIIPIYKQSEGGMEVKGFVDGLEKMFKAVDIRYKTDWSENSPGWKFNEWEMKGVPIRIEVGAREVQNNQMKVVLRVDGRSVMLERTSDVHEKIQDLLKEAQAIMLQNAEKRVKDNTVTVTNEAELAKAVEDEVGFIKFFYKDSKEKAAELKEKYKITPRVIPLETENEVGKDIFTGEDAKFTLFAKAY